MTADDRYGPYGFGERLDSYTRSRVDWDAIDWNQLQNECFQRNAGRFPPAAAPFESMPVRFGLRNKQKERRMTPKWDRFRHTRRTAVVVRAWDGFDYKDEDLFYLRSLIVETSLRTGGEYHVVLLVNIKDPAHNIFASQRAYNKAFRNAGIPPELQSIAVLWDDNLLESWYPLIGEHRTMWQVYQPMQLFALFYPQFDHYWQLELDMRFTGDAGAFLDALSTFARNEPRKQALERATFQHLPTLIGPYSNLAAAVDKVNGGDAHVWGPMPNPAIEPIGPVPPFPTARDDVDFSWGVGEDADALVTSFCANVTASLAWQFRDWVGGMGVEGDEAPRFFSPPAVQRASRTLLLAIHEAQVDMGARVPSEATLPTFALWHGLKLSYAPHPVYWHHPDDTATAEAWWKGGPEESPDGIGPTDPTDHPKGMGLTFWWESHWPRLLVDVWMDVGPNPKEDEYPWLARTEADQVYLPNMMLHPMKHRE